MGLDRQEPWSRATNTARMPSLTSYSWPADRQVLGLRTDADHDFLALREGYPSRVSHAGTFMSEAAEGDTGQQERAEEGGESQSPDSSHARRCVVEPVITSDQLAEIWPEVRPPLLRYLQSRGLSQYDAEDVIQEVACRALTTGQPASGPVRNFLAWCMTVSKNLHLDQVRRDAQRDVTPSRPAIEAGDLLDLVLCQMSLKSVLAGLLERPENERDLVVNAAQGTHIVMERKAAVARNVRVHRIRGELKRLVISSWIGGVILGPMRRMWARSAPASLAATGALIPAALLIALGPSTVAQQPLLVLDRGAASPSPSVVLGAQRGVPATRPCSGCASSWHRLSGGSVQAPPPELRGVKAKAELGPAYVATYPTSRKGNEIICWHDSLLHPTPLCIDQPPIAPSPLLAPTR